MILRRRNPELHMARFYSVALQADLFGGWVLVREWGRIGSPGTVRTEGAAAIDNSEAHAAARASRAIARKQRRGYR